MRSWEGWGKLLNIVVILAVNSKIVFGLGMSRVGFDCSRSWIYVCLLKDFADLDPLAYATAKTYGLMEECAAILEVTGLTVEEIHLPSTDAHAPDPPQPIAPMDKNWPILPSSRSLLEKALTDELGDLSLEESGTNGYTDNFNAFEKDLNGTQESDLINVAEDGESWEEVGDGGAGWYMGEEEGEDELNLAAPEAQAEGITDASSSPIHIID